MSEPTQAGDGDEEQLQVCDEVWSMVLSFLPLAVRCKASLSSTQLARTARDPMLWRQVDLTPYHQSKLPSRLRLLLRLPCALWIRKLSLCNCKELTDKDVTIVAAACKGLRSLNLANCTRIRGKCLEALSSGCPELHELNLRKCFNVRCFVYVLDLLRKMPHGFCLLLPKAFSPEGHLTSESNFRSKRRAMPATAITFINNSSEVVEVYWRNFDGRLVKYHTLSPSEHYAQQTYVAHPWEVITADAKQVLLYSAGTAQPHVAEIQDDALPSTGYVPVPRGKLRSISSRENLRTRPVFRSHLTDPATLHWIDFEGNEGPPAHTIAAGGEVVFDSFLSHAWRIRNQCTGFIIAELILTHQLDVVLQ